METGSEIATGANTTTLISDTATDIDADGPHLTNCFPPKEMWVYEYHDYEPRRVWNDFYGEYRAPRDAKIYLNSDYEVAFKFYDKGITAWHGYWFCTPPPLKTMAICFSQVGDEKNEKMVHMENCPEGTINREELWMGRDDRNRLIQMKLLETYVECTESNVWIKVPNRKMPRTIEVNPDGLA